MSNINLTYNSTSIDLPPPVVGYKTSITMPIDIVQMDDKTSVVLDNGEQYDRRTCLAKFILSTTEQEALSNLYATVGRASCFTMTLQEDCGFFPFGPDKGDAGIFTILMEMDKTPRINDSPFRRFSCDLLFTNIGSYPLYELPPERDDGPWTIGNINTCRMPENLFDPDKIYSISAVITEGGVVHFIDRGSSGDRTGVKFRQQCNESKCAALLYYLTHTQRSASFWITAPSYFYLFGPDHGSSNTYNVILNDGNLRIIHTGHDVFEIDMNIRLVAES